MVEEIDFEDNRVQSKKQKLADIIDAVSDKEDVLTAFQGRRKTKVEICDAPYSEENMHKMASYFAQPLKYLWLRFLAGIFFGLGLGLVLSLVLLLWLNTDLVKASLGTFHKLVGLLKSLGHLGH